MSLNTIGLKYDDIHYGSQLNKNYLVEKGVNHNFLDAFQSGLESIFSNLKTNQSRTFEKLFAAKEYALLETKEFDGTSLFTLTLLYESGLLSSNLINGRTISRRVKSQKVIPKTLEFLDVRLHGYYQYLNGLSVTKNNNPFVLENYLLPRSFNAFDELDSYMKDHELNIKFKGDVNVDSKSLLVWIYCNQDRLILIDKNSPDKALLEACVANNGNYELKNLSVEDIDIYCANIISNFGC
ncbi:hypothetical protein [Pleionea sediminis]|uniref:hypothetical protein n=1 Tax=Pleionea sediminis TaxID=2569479 RepID=UPI0011871ADC|nr:hypothetical protein [Pleionea sediminis]